VAFYRADLAIVCNAESMYLYQSRRQAEAMPIRRPGVELAEGLVAEPPIVPAHRALLAEGYTGLAAFTAITDPEGAARAIHRAIELGDALAREIPGHVHYIGIARTAK
jgi:hypothetical protein